MTTRQPAQVTPAIRRAVAWVAATDAGDWSHRTPRKDVLARAAHLGYLGIRTGWVHTGRTYNSKKRLSIIECWLTDAGRQLLEGAQK